MIVFPNAKINIGLKIINQRDDGFHNIESILYPVPWHDALECISSERFLFRSEGISSSENENDNLCVKAFRRMNVEPVELCLLKNIPVGAGLGGGSADAVFTISLLNSFFKLNLPPETLQQKAASLGSDCTFFLLNKPALVTGKGDELNPIHFSLKNYFIAIVYPNIQISSARAYAQWDQQERKTSTHVSFSGLIHQPIKEWKNIFYNDFEKIIFDTHPEIRRIKDSLYERGALFSSMSGSGSSVYGLFEKPVEIPTENNYRVFTAMLP
jgi:4-diphosphocytidyl-2-C-methyl-D-erythritol kinase